MPASIPESTTSQPAKNQNNRWWLRRISEVISKTHQLVQLHLEETPKDTEAYHRFVCRHEAGHIFLLYLTLSEIPPVFIRKMSFEKLKKLSDTKRAFTGEGGIDVGGCKNPRVRVDYLEDSKKLWFLLALCGIAATLDHPRFDEFQAPYMKNDNWNDIIYAQEYLADLMKDRFPDGIARADLDAPIYRSARMIADVIRDHGGSTVIDVFEGSFATQQSQEKDLKPAYQELDKKGYYITDRFSLRKKLLAIDFTKAFDPT